MKSKRKFLMLPALAIASLLACCMMFGATTQIAHAESAEEYHVDSGAYNSFTDTNEPNGIEIKRYTDNYYATKASLSGVGILINLTVSGDDPIVNIVPRELFLTTGTTFYIGREYGFIIETQERYLTDLLYSRVAVFDIESNNNLVDTFGHYQIKITKLFEAEYAYVTRDSKEILMQVKQERNFFNEGYVTGTTPIKIEAAGDGFVVPVPRAKSAGAEFKETNLFFLTDFVSQLSLYNVNHFNPLDGSLYNPEQDMGAYFTQLDFGYTGKFVKGGEGTWWDAGTIAMNAASLSWDLFGEIMNNPLASAVKSYPVIGMSVSALDFINSMVELSAKFSDKIVSDQKLLTYTPYHTYRQAQLEANGFLNKDIQYAVTQDGERNLYIGTGDSVTIDAQVTGTDAKWETRIARLLMMNAVKIKDVTLDTAPLHQNCSIYSKISGQSAVYTETLKLLNSAGTEAPAVARKARDVINIFPSSKPHRSITAEVNGRFKFTAENSDINFQLYSSPDCDTASLIAQSGAENGNQIIDTWLEQGEYFLSFAQNGSGRIMQFPFVYDHTLNLNMGNNAINLSNSDKETLYFHADKNRYYNFSFQDNDASLQLLDENFNVIESSENGFLSVQLSKNSDVYLKAVYSTPVTKTLTINVNYQKSLAFDSCGGNAINPLIVIDDNITDLPVPQRTAYRFDGWSEGVNTNVLSAAEISAIDLHNVLLYAQWTPVQYTITYEENGGSQLSDRTYTIEQNLRLETNVTRSGYMFLGWYDNPQFNGSKIEILEGEYGNKTFYADWVQTNQVISLDVNAAFTDGDSAQIAMTMKEVIYGSSYTLPVPYIKGFDFDGWYLGDRKFAGSDGVNVNVYSERHNTSLTAKWTRRSFFIKVNVDGTFKWLTNDKLSEQPTEISYSKGLCPDCWLRTQVPLSQYYKEGHVLDKVVTAGNPNNIACWNTISDVPENGASIELLIKYRKEINFKVVFYEYSESVMPSITAAYGDSITLPAPSLKGYNFVKWVVADYNKNDKFNGTAFQKGSMFQFGHMPDLSVNSQEDGTEIYLKAVFQLKMLTIILDDRGERTTITVQYGERLTGVHVPSARYGYTFLGWCEKTDNSKKILIDADGEMIENWYREEGATLYADWSANEYTLTYKNGDTEVHSEKIKFNETKNLFNIPHEHYILKWEINGTNYSGTYTHSIAEDITANAVLIGETYAIEFTNLTYGNYRAYLTLGSKNSYYYGEVFNIQELVPSFGDSSNPSKMVFDGWYTDTDFKSPIVTQFVNKDGDNVSSFIHGKITAYAKWRFEDALTFLGHNHTINDDGIFSNPSDKYSTHELRYFTWHSRSTNVRQSLLDMGMTKFKLVLDITIAEIKDGYQHIYLYDGESCNNLLWSDTIEHGPGKRDTIPRTYRKTIEIDLNSMSENLDLCLRYNASGVMDDDYEVLTVSMESVFY